MTDYPTEANAEFTRSAADGAGSTSSMLKVAGVTKTFEGLCALGDVGFSVSKGHIKALIGPNGAGKTTMLNIINGLLRPEQGQVLFQGHDLVKMSADRIASVGIARTFQLIRLFSVNDATVLDNVMIGAHKFLRPTIAGSLFFRSRTSRRQREAKEKAMEMLRFVGLEACASMQPGALSFGNQRLVELARSLMADPRLLLLDEPASGLNDREVESFMELLSAIKSKGVTILIVEHNMKLVMKVSDDIVALDFGRWLAEGPPSAICSDPLVIQAYLGTGNAPSGKAGAA
jgi:ABC-type branched-subunit amino acid transport system ATPase component